MDCPRCRFENPQDAQFCIDCGAALKTEQKPATLSCPQCRTENNPGSAFCINCGNSLKAGKAETKKDILPEPEIISPEAKPEPELKKTDLPEQFKKKIVCPQCHSENEGDSSFCIGCGASLKLIPAASAAKPAKLLELKPEPAKSPELKPDLKPQVPPAPQLAAEPKPVPAIPVEPKLKAELPAEVTPSLTKAKPKPVTPPEPKLKAESLVEVAPSAAKAKPEPATPPAPKKGPPAPLPVAERIETRRLPKQDIAAGPAISGMKKIEVASPTPERASTEAKHPQTKKLILPVGIVLAVMAAALAIWYFALRPQPSPKPALQATPAAKSAPLQASSPAPAAVPQPIPPAATQTKYPAEKERIGGAAQSPAAIPPPAENKQGAAAPRPTAPPIPSKPAAQPAVAASEQIARGIEAFQQKDYDECIKLMKSVLAQDSGNKTAQRYLADSQNKKKEAQEIGSLIKAAGEAYQAGEFEQCLEQTKRALALDPNQEEALRYEEIAHQKLAPQRIKSLVDQFAAAVNGGQLLPFYEASCSPAFFQRIKRNVELMNTMYSQFQSQCSQTTIRFLEKGLIEVRFSNITTGLLDSENRRMIIFEGAYVWTLQRQGDQWMIAGIQSQPVRKKD
jgi:tetratricopeptide (TPR) repeat protein